MKNRFFTPLLALAVIGCEDTSSPRQPELSPAARQEIVIDNCRSLRDAAIAFAADNDGQTAAFRESVNLLGNTVEDYLSDPLTNPFTGDPEPSVWWSSGPWVTPTDPGQIGYSPMDADADGVWDGFLIEGVGCDGNLSYSFARTGEGDSEEVGPACDM